MLESRAARRLGEARPYFGPMRFAMCLALGDDTGKEQRRSLSCSSIAGDAQWLSTLPACQTTGGAGRQVRAIRAPDVYDRGGVACARSRCAPPAPPRRGDARASALLPRGPRVQAVRRTGAGPASWGGEGGRVLRSYCALFVFDFYR